MMSGNRYVLCRGVDLVHYLTFAPGWNKERSSANFTARYGRQEQKKAFQDVFGNFKDIDKAFELCQEKITFNSYVLQNPPQTMKRFSSRLLSVGGNEAELGTYRCFP